MSKKSGCKLGYKKVKGKCVPTEGGGRIYLTGHESDVLFSNLYDLTKYGRADVERFPHGDPIATGFFGGKTELQLLKSIMKKTDKVRP